MNRQSLKARLYAIENAEPEGPIPFVSRVPEGYELPTTEPKRSIALKSMAGEPLTDDEWVLMHGDPEDIDD